VVDLRSDTVTLPTDAMREAIARAPVGDDQFGEDPSVNALQERVAALLGKEAALFLPTGTMANQLPLKLYCQPGDDVVVGEESHAVWHETGAAAANAGVQFTTAGAGGLYSADELRAVMKPRGHLLFPPTTLVEVEDTHNRMGGLVWDRADLEAVAAAAREHGRPVHRIADETLEYLRAYPWPGNVRQLCNAMERALFMADGPILLPEHLPAEIREHPSAHVLDSERRIGRERRGQAGRRSDETILPPLEALERDHIRRALALTGGHLGRAADLLGIHRNTLRRKLRSWGLREHARRSRGEATAVHAEIQTDALPS
jgi:hypothetical protein